MEEKQKTYEELQLMKEKNAYEDVETEHPLEELIRLREEKETLLDALGDLIDFCDGLDCNYHLEETFLGDDYYQNYKTILEKAIKARDKAKGDTNE